MNQPKKLSQKQVKLIARNWCGQILLACVADSFDSENITNGDADRVLIEVDKIARRINPDDFGLFDLNQIIDRAKQI